MSVTELFLDDEMISCMRNISRQIGCPEKYPDNPIVRSEYPWEGNIVTVYGSILRNEEDTGFRMWYMSVAGQDQTMNYAESNDGVHWQKPLFDIIPYGDCKKTNIVMGPEVNIHGPCVICNPVKDNLQERYLAFYDSYSKYRPEVPEVQSIFRWTYTAVSPDGLHWSPPKGRPAIAGKSDTGQSVVWDPIKRRFLAFMRGILNNDGTRIRYVRYAESQDFKRWENEIELLQAEDPREQFHQFSVTRYGDIYIGFLSIFHIEDVYSTSEYPIFEEGTCDTQLAVSRDGLHWHHVADGAVFLPRGKTGAWDSQWIVTASQMVLHDNKIWIYYAATDKRRSEGHHYQIGLAQLPRDRFVSLVPTNLEKEAIVELKPQVFSAGNLILNADASSGEIQVELRDFSSQVLEGFSRSDCQKIVGDSLDHVVQWNGKGLPQAVTMHKAPIRIRIYLRRAMIYALCFREEK